MNKAEIREILDNAMMEIDALRFRRSNGLVMEGWQTIGNNEGIKLIIDGEWGRYDKFYNVVTLTEDKRFKINIWDRDKNCLSDSIKRENDFRKEDGEELLTGTFENIVDALELGHDIVEYWELGEEEE